MNGYIHLNENTEDKYRYDVTLSLHMRTKNTRRSLREQWPPSLVTNPPCNATDNRRVPGILQLPIQDSVRNGRKFKSPHPRDLAVIKSPHRGRTFSVKSPAFARPPPSRLTLLGA